MTFLVFLQYMFGTILFAFPVSAGFVYDDIATPLTLFLDLIKLFPGDDLRMRIGGYISRASLTGNRSHGIDIPFEDDRIADVFFVGEHHFNSPLGPFLFSLGGRNSFLLKDCDDA